MLKSPIKFIGLVVYQLSVINMIPTATLRKIGEGIHTPGRSISNEVSLILQPQYGLLQLRKSEVDNCLSRVIGAVFTEVVDRKVLRYTDLMIENELDNLINPDTASEWYPTEVYESLRLVSKGVPSKKVILSRVKELARCRFNELHMGFENAKKVVLE